MEVFTFKFSGIPILVDSTNLEGIIPKADLGFALSGEEMQNLEKLDQKKRLQVLIMRPICGSLYALGLIIIPWT